LLIILIGSAGGLKKKTENAFFENFVDDSPVGVVYDSPVGVVDDRAAPPITILYCKLMN
jgi:hypothetical protein